MAAVRVLISVEFPRREKLIISRACSCASPRLPVLSNTSSYTARLVAASERVVAAPMPCHNCLNCLRTGASNPCSILPPRSNSPFRRMLPIGVPRLAANLLMNLTTSLGSLEKSYPPTTPNISSSFISLPKNPLTVSTTGMKLDPLVT